MKDTVGLQVNVDGSMKLFLSTYRMGVWGYGRVLVWGGFMGGGRVFIRACKDTGLRSSLENNYSSIGRSG